MRNLRTSIAALSCAAALGVFSSCAAAPPPAELLEPGLWTGGPIVQTRYGAVQALEDADDTWVWKAIPYAAPPVGDLRWRAPREPQPWAGVRSSRSFNRGATQFVPLLGGVTGSEDCLYLNVWRPRDSETGLPVYVWIHGGGNSIGSSTMVADYYGNRIASTSGMVFVSINYRLGPLGWFSHPALREGHSAEDDSGNYGTLDIIQALRWIKDTISAFGGDPRRVTVAGESAGGANILSLLLSPRAKGLFNAAIVESGYKEANPLSEVDKTAEAALRKLLVKAGKARSIEDAAAVSRAMSPEEVRAFLRSRSDRQIIRSYEVRMVGMSDSPYIFTDGSVIPSSGFEAFETGQYPNKIPLIIGSNREELKLFQFLANSPPWRSELYRATAKYGGQKWKAESVDAVARSLTLHADQPPVYAYEFAWGTPDAQGESPMPGNWGTRLGAFHSLEIPFFLGTDTLNVVMGWWLFTKKNEPGRKSLSSAMMSYAAGLARGGDPNSSSAEGLPRWEPWSNEPGAPKSMVFDADLRSAVIGMSNAELTVDGVFAAVDRDLAEPVRSQVREALKRR